MARSGGTWRPGQSGNPKGRPRKGNAIAEELQRILEEERDDPARPGQKATGARIYAEAAWRRAVNGDSTALRIVIEHTGGKPHQTIDLTTMKPTIDEVMETLELDGTEG